MLHKQRKYNNNNDDEQYSTFLFYSFIIVTSRLLCHSHQTKPRQEKDIDY